MQLTNGELFMARIPLEELVKLKLPVGVAYRLAQNVNKLNEQFQVIEECRNGLVKKWGARREDGQWAIDPTSENFERFLAEFNELMNIEVELVIEKVKLPAEVDGKPLEIEPLTLMRLVKFVEV